MGLIASVDGCLVIFARLDTHQTSRRSPRSATDAGAAGQGGAQNYAPRQNLATNLKAPLGDTDAIVSDGNGRLGGAPGLEVEPSPGRRLGWYGGD